jgi:hypothetical protein
MTPVRSKPVESEKSTPYDASAAKPRRSVEKMKKYQPRHNAMIATRQFGRKCGRQSGKTPQIVMMPVRQKL